MTARPRTHPFRLGDLVEIDGGARGVIAEVRENGAGTRYRVWLNDPDGGPSHPRRDVAELPPIALLLAMPCPYCGRGPCRGSALSANGRDVDRFARGHPAAGVPVRFREEA